MFYYCTGWKIVELSVLESLFYSKISTDFVLSTYSASLQKFIEIKQLSIFLCRYVFRVVFYKACLW